MTDPLSDSIIGGPLHHQIEEDDVFGSARYYQEPQIFHGVIGWNDSDVWYEKGTADDDGHTLIRVQLWEGRDHIKTPPKDGMADGRKLLCHMNAMFGFRIPNRGSRCMVAIPSKMMGKPGAGVIIATIEKNPLIQYDQDRIQMNFGDDKHVVIRAKSITLTDPSNRYLMVGTSRAGGNGMILCQDETGSGWMVQNSVIGMQSASGGAIKSLFQMTTSEIGLCQNQGGGSFLKLGSGKFIGVAQSASLAAGSVLLGPAATALTTALYGVTGVAGIASTSVFLSP